MYYDAIVYLISVALFVILIYIEADKEQWRVKSKLYFARIVYGLFSLPFTIFMYSPFVSILTKARPTAYDKQGNTMPTLDSVVRLVKKREKDEEEEKKKFNESEEYSKLLGGIDIQEIFEEKPEENK